MGSSVTGQLAPFVRSQEGDGGKTETRRVASWLFKEGLLMSAAFFLPPNHRLFPMSAPSFCHRVFPAASATL